MSRLSRHSRGFSLTELLVAIAIGLVLTLAISMMVARQESIRRGVTSGNDLTGNTAYAAYMLDRELRGAGAGVSQAAAENFGCVLNVSRNNAQLLPAAAALPAPFASAPQTYRLAPLIVQDIFRTLQRINAEGLTIFLVEQNVRQALKLAQRAYVLENGRVVLQGSGAELLGDPRVQAAYLGH